MTQEDKELLFKDLCARLPYEVKISLNSYPKPATLHSITPNHSSYFKIEEIGYDFRTWEEDIKPYLRPMSSMTKEEKKEFHKLKQFSVTVVMPNGVSLLKPTYIVDLEEDGDGLNHLYDWLNAHHFDYRGLIEKGLAIEAPDGMYNLKEK